MEGGVAVAAMALYAEDGCIPGGMVVAGEFRSGKVRCHYSISPVRHLGGDTIIYFRMPSQTKGTAYSVVGGGVLCQMRRTILVAEAEEKIEVGTNFDKM